LLWIPLGAGGRFVKHYGQAYERLIALREDRAPRALFHSALIVNLDGGHWAIESTPVPTGDPASRHAVVNGAVGAKALGRLRVFKYEVRCAPGGRIPDESHALGGRHPISEDVASARALLAAVPLLPTPTWGRDESGVGEMWNSNAIVAWLLERAGIDADPLSPPDGGRAPGWAAGIAVAQRGN
jgi:hypothetical protein